MGSSKHGQRLELFNTQKKLSVFSTDSQTVLAKYRLLSDGHICLVTRCIILLILLLLILSLFENLSDDCIFKDSFSLYLEQP